MTALKVNLKLAWQSFQFLITPKGCGGSIFIMTVVKVIHIYHVVEDLVLQFGLDLMLYRSFEALLDTLVAVVELSVLILKVSQHSIEYVAQ